MAEEAQAQAQPSFLKANMTKLIILAVILLAVVIAAIFMANSIAAMMAPPAPVDPHSGEADAYPADEGGTLGIVPETSHGELIKFDKPITINLMSPPDKKARFELTIEVVFFDKKTREQYIAPTLGGHDGGGHSPAASAFMNQVPYLLDVINTMALTEDDLLLPYKKIELKNHLKSKFNERLKIVHLSSEVELIPRISEVLIESIITD